MLVGRDVLLTERKGHIYTITVNREERRNAQSMELYERISEEYENFNEDDDLWVMIVTAKGDVAFSAGHDLKEDVEGDVRGGPRGGIKSPGRRRPHPGMSTFKPTIAAVNGYAMAGGWMMAQRCDVRIAAEHATFGIPEVKWNLPASFATEIAQFPTMAIASELVLWGHTITAQRAYEIGFVNKVVPKEQLMDEAMEWAEEMCTLGQPAVRAFKRLLYAAQYLPTTELASMSDDLFYWWPAKPGVTIDANEGARAFVEKRQPQFEDQRGDS